MQLKNALFCSNFITWVSKVGEFSWGWPEDSLFDSYYTKVLGRVLFFSLDYSTLPLIPTSYCWVLRGYQVPFFFFFFFFFKSLVWLNLGLNPGLLGHWRIKVMQIISNFLKMISEFLKKNFFFHFFFFFFAATSIVCWWVHPWKVLFDYTWCDALWFERSWTYRSPFRSTETSDSSKCTSNTTSTQTTSAEM